jgi:hypothetical protein
MSRRTGVDFKICYVCGERITENNSAGVYKKKLSPICIPCHAETAFCRWWSKKTTEEIIKKIARLHRNSSILSRMLELRNRNPKRHRSIS